MFTTVTSKIEGHAETLPKGDVRFAFFLLLVLAIPFGQLLVLVMTTLVSRQCAGSCELLTLGSDAWWVLMFHVVTVAPLLTGTAYWFWRRSSVGRRLEPPISAENAERPRTPEPPRSM